MAADTVSLDTLTAFAKRRGFIFPGSELYGGVPGLYDYGPYGVELARNIRAAWWRAMVQEDERIVGIDSAIVTHPKVWEASGHVAGFSDPLVECKACGARARADHLLEGVGVAADERMSVEELNERFNAHRAEIACPSCGARDFTAVRMVNLLVQTNLGNFSDEWRKEPAYLRGETCQGIYLNFKNVLDTTRVKVPFGIAQIGKAFRNEISPRQFIFRKREFEQMEMQFFVHPNDEMCFFEEWRARRWEFYRTLGFREESLRWHEHENLVFYAKAAWDIEFRFPFGFKELEGIHARGDYDLTQHQKYSGQKLEYFDAATGERYVPHVVETSVGLDRLFFAVLTEFYDEDVMGGETRVVLRVPYALAPVKAAVFPLLKNKPALVAKAREIFNTLKGHLMCEFDDNGNIGKRYRRQDEIGTPYCVTVDFETLEGSEKDTVTVRVRDTGAQRRVPLNRLVAALTEEAPHRG